MANPLNVANQYLDKIPGQIKPYYDPYMQAGNESLDKLKTHYSGLMDNPGEFYNKLGEGYTQSPGYAATLRTALSGANRAAAMGQGGGLGSYGHQQMAAGAAGNVANKDYEKYINHVLGLHTEGVTGEQGLETQGYNANKDYADTLANISATQGTNAANQATAQNQQHAQLYSSIISALGGVGGAILGGPAGAAIGTALSNYFNKGGNNGQPVGGH